jgi:hypothetical protein
VHKQLKPQRGFFNCCKETFCFKWKPAHGRLFHRCAFQKCNTLNFLGGAAAAQRLAVAMQGHQPSSAVPSNIMALDLENSDSD